jgi:2,3-bisphosphoglycerate-independent phosphoglycerate mutase
MTPKKILYVVLDGLGDDALDALGGRTPLEAAHKPSLDRLVSGGRSGYVTTVGEGIAPESDIAVFAILGYDPFDLHTGRGPLEAVGAGLDLAEGELAYRVNFATVERDQGGWLILDRRVGRSLSSDDAIQLGRELDAGVRVQDASFDFRATVGHRGVLVLRSDQGPLSAEVTNSDPAYGRRGSLGVANENFDNHVIHVAPVEGHETDDAAIRAAEITNRWLAAAFEVLDNAEANAIRRAAGKLPGNFVLTRDPGDHLPELVSFKDRFGPEMGCFVEMPVELGIARLTKMGVVEAPAGMDPSDQYEAWAALALEAIDGFDGLYIHIKGPDVFAHDGDHEGKIASIEAIDAHFFDPLLEDLDLNRTIVAVTADHSTSCARKAHTDAPVPLLVSGGSVTSDGVASFDEVSCRRGSLGHLRGPEIVPLLVSAATD